MLIHSRIDEANAILRTFLPEVELYAKDNRLRMRWDVTKICMHHRPASLRDTGDYLVSSIPCCDPYDERALAQLVRYVRDFTRMPIVEWERWITHKTTHITTKTIVLLQQTDYPDPAKTKCVLCGSNEYPTGIAWWNWAGRNVGPRCRGGCVKKGATT